MYEGFDIWIFLSGLPLGLAIFGIVYFFVRKKAKKERLYDERYTSRSSACSRDFLDGDVCSNFSCLDHCHDC